MKVKPLKNYLLIQMIESEESTKSGILLAESARGDSNIAKVVETAEYIDDNQDILLKNDTILINPGSGKRIRLDGNEYLIISQEDVLAILSY